VKEETALLNINGKQIQNQQTIANSFIDYFSTTAKKLMGANQIDKMSRLKNGASLLYIQSVQHKSGSYFNMSNLFTNIYNMLYYTTNLYLQ
jgi:hypothetical protein